MKEIDQTEPDNTKDITMKETDPTERGHTEAEVLVIEKKVAMPPSSRLGKM